MKELKELKDQLLTELLTNQEFKNSDVTLFIKGFEECERFLLPQIEKLEQDKVKLNELLMSLLVSRL